MLVDIEGLVIDTKKITAINRVQVDAEDSEAWFSINMDNKEWFSVWNKTKEENERIRELLINQILLDRGGFIKKIK